MFTGIRFKLSLIAFVLVALITAGSSLIVIHIMDEFLLGELSKRGFSISRGAATFAGYSLLSGDRLALDNLASKIKEHQKDLRYVAIVGEDGIVKAHSELNAAGKVFPQIDGELIKEEEGAAVKRVRREGVTCYEFKTTILFTGRKVGEFYLGIDADPLVMSKVETRRKIVMISALVLGVGVIGVFFLSVFITSPIKRLTEGVSRLKSGEYEGRIPIVSRDELGELTNNFNEMAKVIMEQKRRLEKYSKELEEAYFATVRVLSAAIDARDQYTLGHSTRVAEVSLLVGRKLGLTEEELRDLEMACLFHDVGKIRTPDRILNKDERLNDDEYKFIMKHPEDGTAILRLAESLHKYIPAVLYHHEWYNGNGYPEGLRGGAIPLFASIISIADAYDAMRSSRPYSAGVSKEEALREILHFGGKQFDPQITNLFVEVMKDYGKEQDI